MPKMVKCRLCGKSIPKEDAVIVIENTKKKFFCSLVCASKAEIQRQEKSALKESQDNTYNEIKDLIGGYSWALFLKFMPDYTNKQGYDLVCSYIKDNRQYLDDVLAKKTFTNQYNKLKYLCAILINNLPYYKPQKEENQSVRHLEYDDSPVKKPKTNKYRRRSMDEIMEAV